MNNRLFVTNLPVGISETELRRCLVRDFEEFRVADRDDTLQITVFQTTTAPSGRPRQTAIIHGFQVDYNNLIARAVSFKCGGRDWAFKPDRGDPRNPDGTFVNPLTASNRRVQDGIHGITHRPIWLIFLDYFLNSVKCGIELAPLAFTRLKNVTPSQIGAIHALSDTRGTTKLRYASRLDCCQQIAYWNDKLLPNVWEVITFTNGDGTTDVTFNDQVGFGKEFERLNIGELQTQNGYVPLDKLHDMFFAKGRMKNMRSFCWKCQTPYTLRGIDSDLRYVAGRCSCKFYETHLDILHKDRAFFQKNEKFTRLVHGRPDNNGLYEWIISHAAMKGTYESGKDYRDTLAPILMDEWKTFSTKIKQTNTCEGVIESCVLVDSQVTDNGNTINRYALAITVNRTDYYCETNAFQIGGLTLSFHLEVGRGQIIFVKRKAKISSIRESVSPRDVIIYAHVKVEAESVISLGYVHIVPKPIKTEYESLKRSLSKLEKGKLVTGFENILLKPTSRFLKEQLQLPEESAWSFHKAKDFRLAQELNEEQRKARMMAVKTVFTVLHGPPGTGKSFTLASMASTLVFKEKGVVLAVCPSNFACDNLAAAIGNQLKRYSIPGTPKRVLRIFSKKREIEMIRSHSKRKLGDNVDILHEIVQELLFELNDDGTKAVLEKMMRGEHHLITTDDMTELDKIVEKMERKLFNEFKVIVCTVGCLSDYRLMGWNKVAEKVNTIIVDEAAYLLQPCLLSCLQLQPKRMIMGGDPRQLQAILHSFSATLSGLGVSGMEYVERSNVSEYWINLKEQYRMAPAIREIVSNLTYGGSLRDADSVVIRFDRMFPRISQMFQPPLKSPVVVYNHHFEETREKTNASVSNIQEARMAAMLCHHLISKGVQSADIAVLTFYDQQRKLIQGMVNNLGVVVSSVDGFQGKESPYVILSFTRGNEIGVGFVSDQNRLNVSISRAQDLLICLINLDCFKNHRNHTITKFISELEKKADIRNA